MGKMKGLWRFPVLLTVSLLILALFPSISLQQEERFEMAREDNSVLMLDDFSEEPGGWTFLDAARWDAGSGYVVLTEPGSDRVGVMWLKKNVTSPFTAEFRYRVGGGSGADGFVFMFYKDTDYEPGIGGYLGFLCRPVEKPCPRDEAPGYGLEFDNYFNSEEAYGMGDPSPSHIALLKDHINNHLIHVNDTRTEDDRWHRVRLVVQEGEIAVFVDDGEVFRWAGPIDRSFGGVGFGSGIWGLDHRHIIDNFRLYGNTFTVRGLQPGWRAEIFDGEGVLAESAVAGDGGEASVDVVGLAMPLEGRFRVYDGGTVMYESPGDEEIWGGDTWILRLGSDSASDGGGVWDPETIAVAIGVVALALLIGFLLLSRRRTTLVGSGGGVRPPAP